MLSIKERKYVKRYWLSGNAKASAIEAGYAESTALKKSFAWIAETRAASAKPEMWDYLKQLQKEALNEFTIERGEILKVLANILRFDINNLYDELGDLKAVADIDSETRQAINSIEVEEKILGEQMLTRLKKIKASDRIAAIATINKMLGYNAAEEVKHGLGETFLDFLKKATAAG